jgi:hypothetical protein
MQLIKRRQTVTALFVAAALSLAGCSGSSSSGGSPSIGGHSSQAAPPTCPLTGLPATGKQDIKRPALAIKIDNVSDAQPQAGVNNADLVVEEEVEGGLTRLMAIYQCQKAPVVGPIRSARITDAYLLALLHGSVLGYSGANPKDMPPIEEHSGSALVSYDQHPEYFHLDSSRPAPHDVFASTQTLLKVGLKERPKLQAPPALFSYGAIDPTARRAHSIYLGWPAASAQWTWNGKGWLRTQDGSADNLVDGTQVSATNVVILNVSLQATGIYDIDHNPSPLDVTIGSNPAWVLRDGKMTRGKWSRQSIGNNISLTDKAGKPIALEPGRTWIELLPTGSKPQRR